MEYCFRDENRAGSDAACFFLLQVGAGFLPRFVLGIMSAGVFFNDRKPMFIAMMVDVQLVCGISASRESILGCC